MKGRIYKYVKQDDLWEIFGYKSLDSFRKSRKRAELVRNLNELVKRIEDGLCKQIKG